jgi:hypothetical protein
LVSVRIDQRNAFASSDVLAEHGVHQCALAGPGLADEVQALAARHPVDAEGAARAA